MMTENEARKLEVPIEWNGKANVCTYCGRVPETFYIVTGHDHTDDSIRWCICRDGAQYKSELEQLRQRVAENELLAQAAVIEKLRDALDELVDLVQDIRAEEYKPDSFTCQPALAALAIPTDSTQILDEVRKQERERCAALCEKSDRYRGDYFAAKIRAMGDE